MLDSMRSGSKFNSEDYTVPARHEAWNSVVARFGFLSQINHETFSCSASAQASLLGIDFFRINSSAQHLKRVAPPREEALLLVLLADGALSCESGSKIFTLAPGDVFVAPASADMNLSSSSTFRSLFVSIPKEALNTRIFQSKLSAPRLLKSDRGSVRVLSSLLGGVLDALDSLQEADFRPIDQLLVELLLAALNAGDAANLAEDPGIHSSVLRRVCQNIESKLSDRNLNLVDVARTEGVSPRYLQRLFEKVDESFSHYVMKRRLDRSAGYLVDPKYERLSISEISFACGFSDPAHFSRTFKARFATSPKDYRKNQSRTISGTTRAHRGWPSNVRVDSGGFAPDGDNVALKAEAISAANLVALAGGHVSHFLRATPKSMHWGFFSRSIPPVIEVKSGDLVTVETLTQHASDDYERMIAGDADVEEAFLWTAEKKSIDRRGAGPMNASVLGRGAGEGFGTQIMTGPIAVEGAQPGDVLEVRIIDIRPRPCANPKYLGRSFGSNAATWWGYHFKDLLTAPQQRENVTIYEIFDQVDPPHAKPIYCYNWTPQVDPFGVTHSTIDYPGIPVDHSTIKRIDLSNRDVMVPLRMHFGVIGVAPREAGLVDSIPPSYFGGNIDNWRVGRDSSIFLPVSVPGALLSVGDPHAAMGDAELGGTGIECSMTGDIQIILHKKDRLDRAPLRDLSYPVIETADSWIIAGFSYANYIAELGEKAASVIYESSTIDLAMKDAFRKVRRFLIANFEVSEDQAISIMSVAVDFGISQVVDGNWGVHAIVPKSLFPSG